MPQIIKAEVTEIQDSKSQDTIRQALDEIAQRVREASHAVLQLAETLHEWKKKSTQWDEIVRQLDEQNILKESVLKKLLPIGNNKFLMEKRHWESLPPGYNHLYPLTQIETKKLEVLYQKGEIHAGLTVDQANELKKKFALKKIQKTKSRSSANISRIIKFKVSSDIPKVETKIKTAIKSFHDAIMKIDEDADFKYE